MLWLARSALFASKLATGWPVRRQRLRFQLVATDIAIDCLCNLGREQELVSHVSSYIGLYHALYGEVMEGETGARFASRIADLGSILVRVGHPAQGEELLARAGQFLETAPADDNRLWASSIFNLGAALLSLDRPGEALRWLTRAHEMRARVHGADSFEMAQSHDNLGICLKDLGRLEEAEQTLREAVRLHARHSGQGSRQQAGALNNLADTLLRSNRAQEALECQLQAVGMMPPSDANRCVLFDTLSDAYCAVNRIPEGLISGRTAVDTALSAGRPLQAIEFSRNLATRLRKYHKDEEASAFDQLAKDLTQQSFFDHAKIANVGG